ncbi:MAG: hypothetical protein RLZZ91_1980 [Bacteroidota bacterium]|jgi:hypothetical protein
MSNGFDTAAKKRKRKEEKRNLLFLTDASSECCEATNAGNEGFEVERKKIHEKFV